MGSFDLPKIHLPSQGEMNAKWIEKTLRDLSNEQAENLANAIRELITLLEKDLTPEQALSVTCNTAAGTMKVTDFHFPNWNVAVIGGIDSEGNQTIVLSSVQTLQLTCKVIKSKPDAKRTRIGFVLPQEK